MNAEFTIVWKGQSSGPFNQLEIQKKLLAGEITPLHVILRQGEQIDAIAWVSQLRSAVREEEAEARRQEEARTGENERLRFHQQENERLQRELKEAQQKAARPLPPPPPRYSDTTPNLARSFQRFPTPPPASSIMHLKPQQIKSAVIMLWLSLLIGIPRSLLAIPNQREETLLVFFIVILFTIAFMIFFIQMINNGKNWARITFLILSILGMPLAIYQALDSVSITPISALLGMAQVILQIIAIIFLFAGESAQWFKIRKLVQDSELMRQWSENAKSHE